MINRFMCLMLFVSLASSGYAQRIQQFSLSLYTEAVGLPFTNYSPIHPGIELAATFHTNDKEKSIRYARAKAGFFYHQRLETAVYLGGEYQYSLKVLNQKLSIDLPAGLGYMHTFYPAELYEQDESGDFTPINQLGRSHLYVNLGLGLTYLGTEKVQPFIRQELMLETPFANGIPAIPHSLLKFGVQINL